MMAGDRLVLYELTGGNLGLDLTNTVMNRAGEAPDELLPDYPSLLRWSEQTGILDWKQVRALRREAERHPAAAARVHKRAVELRETIFDLFSGSTIDEAKLRKLESFSNESLRHRALIADGSSVGWQWERQGLDQMLWPVIEAATELLTSERRGRVRVCGGDECRWLFIDNSRQGNRRWCDMTTCGNRAKAKRHYEKCRARQDS